MDSWRSERRCNRSVRVQHTSLCGITIGSAQRCVAQNQPLEHGPCSVQAAAETARGEAAEALARAEALAAELEALHRTHAQEALARQRARTPTAIVVEVLLFPTYPRLLRRFSQPLALREGTCHEQPMSLWLQTQGGMFTLGKACHPWLHMPPGSDALDRGLLDVRQHLAHGLRPPRECSAEAAHACGAFTTNVQCF